MASQPFSTRPSYVESIRGLHRLHALAEAGRDDSPEAESLRDRLEFPWRDLSDTEKARITGLSEDLYSISTPHEQILPMSPEAEEKIVEALAAFFRGDFDLALGLLRQWGQYLVPALLAYLRGSIWRAAGDQETAALFLQYAARLELHESVQQT